MFQVTMAKSQLPLRASTTGRSTSGVWKWARYIPWTMVTDGGVRSSESKAKKGIQVFDENINSYDEEAIAN